MTPKASATIEKIGYLDFIEIKNIYALKWIIKK